MSFKIISTWRMSFDGMEKAHNIMSSGGKISDAIVEAVCDVEDNPLYNSVGNGGLPNINCEVELDAAFMDGNNLAFGGVMAVKNIKNPVKVARELSKYKRNVLLAAAGAEKFAEEAGFDFRNNLTTSAATKWKNEVVLNPDREKLEAYEETKKDESHDTVCVLGADSSGVYAAVSTSGLFLKSKGRVGDSPVIGSGFYADSAVGAAAGTGVGEDIMKGCLSITVVHLMESGKTPQEACVETVLKHTDRMRRINKACGSISLIAIDSKGNIGAATNKKEFPFVVTDDKNGTVTYLCKNENDSILVEKASNEWIKNYLENAANGTGS